MITVFWEMLDKPFAQLRLEQQLLAALVALCFAALTISSVAFAARRRDGVGLRQSDGGFCQDVSVGGMAWSGHFPSRWVRASASGYLRRSYHPAQASCVVAPVSGRDTSLV
jgi:hypothetical protein